MIQPIRIKAIGISQFFQLPFNVALARRLPLFFLRLYLYFWGLIYLLLRIKTCQAICICLSYIHKSGRESSCFVLDFIKSVFGIFEHYLEKLVMAYKDLDEVSCYLKKRLQVENKGFLDELVRSGKGAILVTGHFGAVEYLPLSLALNGYKVAMICKFKTKTLKKALKERASFFGVKLIDASEPGVVFKAISAIKEGRFLITECDEFSQWRFHKTQRVRVFGQLVPRDRTLDFFVKKAKVPTFLTLMRREGSGFKLVVEPIPPETSASVSVMAWKKLEKHILSFPFQWYQIKGAAKFLMENKIEGESLHKEGKNISDKDTIFSPSFT